MEKPAEAVGLLLSHLNNQGTLIINFPEGNKLNSVMEKEGTIGEHQIFWSREELRDFLSQYGEVEIKRPNPFSRWQLLAIVKTDR